MSTDVIGAAFNNAGYSLIDMVKKILKNDRKTIQMLTEKAIELILKN